MTLRVTNIVTVDPVSITQTVPKNLVCSKTKSIYIVFLKRSSFSEQLPKQLVGKSEPGLRSEVNHRRSNRLLQRQVRHPAQVQALQR